MSHPLQKRRTASSRQAPELVTFWPETPIYVFYLEKIDRSRTTAPANLAKKFINYSRPLRNTTKSLAQPPGTK